MKIPFVDLKAQYVSIKDEINQAISNVIYYESAFIGGKYLNTFEKNFANYIGTLSYTFTVFKGI